MKTSFAMSRKYAWAVLHALRCLTALFLLSWAISPVRAQEIEVQARTGSSLFVPDYAFSGVYEWGEVLSMLCEKGKCRLSVPSDFYSLRVPLSIYEKDFQSALRALKVQAKADGWEILLSKKVLSVRKSVSVDSSAVFVSCLDSSVVSVPRKELSVHLKSDSLRCLSAQNRRIYERDSLRAVQDSLLRGYDLRNYLLEYYSYSSNMLDEWGVKWSEVLASGDFFSKPSIPLNWAIRGVGRMDSLFVFRSVQFRIDSTLELTWGNTSSEVKKVYNDQGIVTTEYEDKDYGMQISLTRSENRLSLEYSFTQNDDSRQKISGASSSLLGDTLVVVGYYKSRNYDYEYVPFLGQVPVLRYLFRYRAYTDDVKFFVLRCVPQNAYKLSVRKATADTARPVQPFTARGVADSLVLEY